MDDRLGITGRLEDRTAPDELATQLHRVGDIAVVRDGEAAGRQVGIERLNVAQRGFARGRIADMAAGDVAGQAADHVVTVEIARDVTHGAVGVEQRAVEAGDPRRFLSAMLERMQAERGQRGRAVGAGHTENAAFLAEFVIVEGVGGQHKRGARNIRN